MSKASNTGGTSLSEFAFVKKLVSDPSNFPEICILTGYLGRDSEKLNWRVYFTLNFAICAIFKEKDVLRLEELGVKKSLLRRSIVWVSRDEEIKTVSADVSVSADEFLVDQQQHNVIEELVDHGVSVEICYLTSKEGGKYSDRNHNCA